LNQGLAVSALHGCDEANSHAVLGDLYSARVNPGAGRTGQDDRDHKLGPDFTYQPEQGQ
jgi:hypothetical protein